MEQNEESRRAYRNGAVISAAGGAGIGAGAALMHIHDQAERLYVNELHKNRAQAMGDYLRNKWVGDGGKPIRSLRDRVKQVEAKGHEGARQAVSKFWKSKNTIGKGLAGLAGGAVLGASGFGAYKALTSKEASDQDSESRYSVAKHVGAGAAAGALAGAAGGTSGIAARYYSDAFDVPYRVSRELGSSRLKSFRYAHETGVNYGLKCFKEDLKHGTHNKLIGLAGVAGAGLGALGGLGYNKYKEWKSKEASDQDSEAGYSLGKHVGVGAAAGALTGAVGGTAGIAASHYEKAFKMPYSLSRELGFSIPNSIRYGHKFGVGIGLNDFKDGLMSGRFNKPIALTGALGGALGALGFAGLNKYKELHSKEASDQDSESRYSLAKHVGAGAAAGALTGAAGATAGIAARDYKNTFMPTYKMFRKFGLSIPTSIRVGNDSGMRYGLKWFKGDLKRGMYTKPIALAGAAGAGIGALGGLGYDKYKELHS